jgi:hypothetical protein
MASSASSARTTAFPPAEGVRVTWAELPSRVRSAVEDRLGARVVAASSRPEGFSPGLASRLVSADSDEVFVKAVSKAANPVSIEIHRREARIATALPVGPHVPRLRWTIDDGEWVILAFDHLAGTTPALPWRADELDRVLGAITELSSSLTPSPIAVETAGELMAGTLTGWRRTVGEPAVADRVPRPWRDRLDELASLEAEWPAAVAGGSLAHLDIRADNVLLTPQLVHVVDWPWAAVAAPWVDVVAFLPSVAMQGGPDPEPLWQRHPLSRGVDDAAADSFLAALAGMFTYQSLQPRPPGLPTLPAFQAGQARTACAWLAHRRRW